MPLLTPDSPTLAPAVASLLRALRRRIRQYIWLEGCAAAVAWLGAAFWITLALDWFFEPPPVGRIVMLAAVAAVLAVVLGRLIGRRAFVPISDSNAATLLERRFPQLNDSLLTAVVLTDPTAPLGRSEVAEASLPDAAEITVLTQEMLAHTCREAEDRIRGVDLGKVFNPRPLWMHCTAAILLTFSVALFAAMFSDAFHIWANRTLAMSSQLWPRHTRLEVVGFDTGLRKVARGADIEIVVRADTTMPQVPETVEIRYRTEAGGRGRATMDRRGIARIGEDSYQEYTYTFRSVLADIQFDVVGGDDRVRNRRIQAVDSPTIQMTLDCTLPAYIGRKRPPTPVTGVMQVPKGSLLTVRANQANKELLSVQIGTSVGDRLGPSKTLRQADMTADHRGFSYSLPPLMNDTTLLFTLTDADEIRSREPLRLMLVPTPDQPPQVAVHLDGIGSAITPQARVAVAGRITDDYGLGRVWFDWAPDQTQPKTYDVPDLPKAPEVVNLADQALDMHDAGLKAGQKLSLCVKAADLCDMSDGPHVGAGERWTLDVVTPEQLRAILEARELVLRQRFEQLLQEMTETRDLLSRMQFASDKPAVETSPKKSEKKAKKGARVEPGEEETADSPERQRDLRFLRVQGAITNCRKGGPEITGVAESFDDICKQLVNNRIDTEELKKRLKGGIADPLHQIADKMFPELDRRLDELQRLLEDPRGPALRDRAQQQADDILLAMRKVRDRMIELEDFNEAVELLRNIVETQKKLHEQTEQRHKEKVRKLLKE